MSARIKRLAACLTALVLLITTPLVGAASPANTLFDGIIAHHLHESGAADIQQYIDGALCEQAGTAAWTILALAGDGNYDFSRYEAALLQYLDTHTIGAASSRLKYALTLAAVGSTDTYITQTMNDAIGKQGVMSLIYGLHLLNNGYTADSHTVASVTADLLARQCEDGGWAVTGTVGDVDVTAMAIQALSDQCGEPAVDAAIDRALAWLAAQQTANGGFQSYGVENSESTAQVLVALSALSIDAGSDARFIKDGNTVFDALARFALSDGRFAHTAGGAANDTATAQVLYSTVAYRRFQAGRGSLYRLDRAVPPHVTTTTTALAATAATTTSPSPVSPVGSADTIGYKPVVTLILVAAVGIVSLVLWLLKKQNAHNLALLWGLAAVLIALVWLTTFASPDEHYASQEPTAPVGTVTLSIVCDAIPDRSAEHIPDDGILLAPTALAIDEGDTVYDLLLRATAAHRIPMETGGGYVEGIAHIYEFDHGDLSGWMYTVNGESPSAGAADYVLTDGDTVVWYYTLTL